MMNKMSYDEAVQIANSMEEMSFDELLQAYMKFHANVENTPEWMPNYTHSWQRGLHGAIGLATEAGEILDAFKKQLYGKNMPLSVRNIQEECGDVFFYLMLIMNAFGVDLRDVVADNVFKLANRYIEKMRPKDGSNNG